MCKIKISQMVRMDVAKRLSKAIADPKHTLEVLWVYFQRRWLFIPLSLYFDRYYSVETHQIIKSEYLKVPKQFKSSHAAGAQYEALSPPLIERMYRLLKRGVGDIPELFVDIGCGKGRACFFMATKPDFEHIVGVEYASDLVAVAEKNLGQFVRFLRGKRVDISLGDGASYILPDQRCVCFLANPFGELIMTAFIANNYDRIKANGSVILYYNNICHQLLVDKFGFSMLAEDKYYPAALYGLK